MLLLDITNWLIGLGFSDHLRNLIKSWSGVLQVTWPLSIRISDHSVSKIPSSSITGRYPRPTLWEGWEVLPIWRSAVGVFNSPSQKFSKTLTKTITYLKRCLSIRTNINEISTPNSLRCDLTFYERDTATWENFSHS